MTTYEVIKIEGFWINSDNHDPSDCDSDNYDEIGYQFVALGMDKYSEQDVEFDASDIKNRFDDIFFWASCTRNDFMSTHGIDAWLSQGSPKDGSWEWVCTNVSDEKYTWNREFGLTNVDG